MDNQDDESTGTGISLWLVPEDPARARLASCIERLSGRLGTPAFPPHVTLLSGLVVGEAEALGATAILARGLVPFALRLGGIGGTGAYFRCLYARVEPTDTLLAAHARASREFGHPPVAEFLPHLSLVYGTLGPREKAALARELDEATNVAFEVRRLDVWRTVGGVDAWAPIGAFALGTPPA